MRRAALKAVGYRPIFPAGEFRYIVSQPTYGPAAMRTAKEAAERTMRLAEQHVAQQEERIERQKKLITSLEADGHTELAQAARRLLIDMAALLANMHDDLAQAQARWMVREDS